MGEEKVFVIKNGTIIALYDDTLRTLGGAMTIERASDVEWDNDAQGWFANIRPQRRACDCHSEKRFIGNVIEHDESCALLHQDWRATLLGPYTTRVEALAAEVAFIQARL